MRTTVGPLSPAVYWRRRAVVLGALLLGIIVWFVACSHEDDTSPNTKNASSSLPTPAPAKPSVSASPTPSGLLDSAPPGGQSYPDPDAAQSQQTLPGDDGGLLPTTAGGANGTGSNTNVNEPADGSCTDAEMLVTPVPATATIKRGAPLSITLKIKNVGTRTCTRDVGADPQELYLDQGAQTVWSSDKCSPARGSDVQSFPPGVEREWHITWNGRQSTTCSLSSAAGPAPEAGQYQLRSRLDQIRSKPVTVTITA
ncbi:adhesin [Actinoplanes oblitus]|uniref:Adhesin n=1 Tax=Actinoplanes oblitus TaxID=3040509 RepID=A0ABY8WEF4_9ACTN|nr:adhesin [Actinoplanes oblitus]WIM96214.1 adhesin [Actinoplanes oblitus]